MLDFFGKLFDTGASLFNASSQRESNEKLAAQNIAHQKEFAQHGIRWKVADAEAAGLHPLAALGAQTSSFSNIVGGDAPELKTNFSGMGQDLSRAMDAGSTADERQDRMGQALTRTAQLFNLEKMNLENEVLKTDISLKRAQLGPALPGSALAHLSRSPARTSAGHPISDDEIKQKPSDAPENKTYKFMGYPLTADPRYSDGQVVENRLGDFEAVSGLTAISNLVADILYSTKSGGARGGSGNPFKDNDRRRFNQRFHFNR